MDSCQLKHSKLAEPLQKYKYESLRGDTVKDDTGCEAVCAGRGSSASQMTAAKVLDTMSSPPEMAGDDNGLCTSQNEGYSQSAQASGDGMPHRMSTSPS